MRLTAEQVEQVLQETDRPEHTGEPDEPVEVPTWFLEDLCADLADTRRVLRATLTWLRARPAIVDGWPRPNRSTPAEIEALLEGVLTVTP